MNVKIAKIAEKLKIKGIGGMNRALKHSDRFDVVLEKYCAIFSGQKQTKRYKVSSFSSRIEALCRYKSMKMRKQSKNVVLAELISPCSILNALISARKSVGLYSLNKNKANGTN